MLIGSLDALHRHARARRKLGNRINGGRHRAFRAVIKQRVLIGAAHLHHHAEQRRNEFLELVACKLGRFVDLRRFALFVEHGLTRRALVSRHVSGDMHAALKQLDDLGVYLVNTRARNRKVDDGRRVRFLRGH